MPTPEPSSSLKEKSSEEGRLSKDSKDTTPLPTLELAAAIFVPQWGNYYHRAFTMHNKATDQWHLYEAAQDREDGPYCPNYLSINPRDMDTARCLEVMPLAVVGAEYEQTLAQNIAAIPVPGHAAAWNCQDYVMEIWEMVMDCGLVSTAEHQRRQEQLLPYYGQDFGGSRESGGDNDEARESPPRQVLSDEFVFDSGSDE